MTHVVDKVLPLLGAIDSDIQRQGAVEALASISEKLQFSIVPYIVLLVVPLLGKQRLHCLLGTGNVKRKLPVLFCYNIYVRGKNFH
jgi:hypothetical protein